MIFPRTAVLSRHSITIYLPAPIPHRAATSGFRAAGPDEVARVRQIWAGQESDAPLSDDEIFKGYEVRDRRFAVLRASEIEALRPRKSDELEIKKFVRTDEIDPNFYNASYYVAPDFGADKAYALAYYLLKGSGYLAMGELAFQRRECWVVIRPGNRGLVLHTLHYPNEVRAGDEYQADRGLISEKELQLANVLLDAKKGTFKPAEIKNKFNEELMQLIMARCQEAFPGGTTDGTGKPGAVVDIMDALRKSIEMVKGPAPVAKKPPRKERSGRTSGKGRSRRRGE